MPSRIVLQVWVLIFLASAGSVLISGQSLHYTRTPNIANGRLLYNRGCISCHGTDGKGAALTSTEFKRPHTFPDFSVCTQTTPETNVQYKAVITYGGKGRGFSRIMPSFRGILSPDDIDDVIAYLRGFCTDQTMPRGELNLPRALVTEKAFPEYELVFSTEANASGAPGYTTHVIHEQTFFGKNQIEIDMPWEHQNENHIWSNHIGDMTFGYKRVMYSNLQHGSIFSLFGGIVPPTGSQKLGGAGTTIFETFAAYNQLFPVTNTWVQLQFGSELPHDSKISPKAIFFNSALGQTLAPDHRLGRQFSPMIEFLAARDLEDGAKTDWDILPQMQVTISQRQHIRADIGYRKPITNTDGRTPQLDFYILWDWFDGAFWKGWR